MAIRKTQAIAHKKQLGPSSLPQFSPEAPPVEWERQHRAPRGRVILGVETWNEGARPVPRLASHHFASAVVRGTQQIRGEHHVG